MMHSHRKQLCSLILVTASGLVVACGDSSSGDDTSSTDAGTSETSGEASAGGSNTFTAVLVDSISESEKTTPHTIVAVNNDTGEPLEGVAEVKSTRSGQVTVKGLPEGLVGFLIKGVEGETLDTLAYGLASNEQNDTLRSTSEASPAIAQDSGNFVPEDDRTAVAGAIYWRKDPSVVCTTARIVAGLCGGVGCATVKVKGYEDDDVALRYLNKENIPAQVSLQTHTYPGAGKGRWYLGNAPKETITVEAYLGDEKIGEGKIAIPFSRSEVSTSIKDALITTRLYVEGPNPTPADCKE
jgi:hypothetical protein